MNAGPDTHELIDAEVRVLVDEGYETAKRILTEKRDDLDRLANGLLEYETLTGKEITRVIHGQPLNRGGGDDDSKDEGGGIAAIPKTGKAAAPGPRRRHGAASRRCACRATVLQHRSGWWDRPTGDGDAAGSTSW